MGSFTIIGKDTKPERMDNYFYFLPCLTTWHLQGEATLCDLKQGTWTYVCTYECFLFVDTFTAIFWIVSFTLLVLKTGNLNIQIGVTPKLHTLGRYSHSSAKGRNFLKCQQKTLIHSLVLLNEFEFTVSTWGALRAERTAMHL